MSEPLTDRQSQILGALRRAVKANGYPPSIQELCAEVGLTSSSSVVHQLRQLEAKGYIVRDPNKPRALTILNPEVS